MPEHPLVSVVIPTYNHEKYLAEAIDSALSQDYENLEIIIVDDGSTDNTSRLVASYGDSLRYIKQENAGLSAARNTGIRVAKGEWVALLDADDVWHEKKTTLQINAVASDPEVALIGARHTEGPLAASDNMLSSETETLCVRDFLVKTPFGPSSAIIRADVFHKVGLFDTGLKAVEDRDMWLRIASEFSVSRLTSRCWHYRVHQEQMSKSAERMFINYEKVLRKFFESNPCYRDLRSEAYAYLHLDSALSFYESDATFRAIYHLALSGLSAPSLALRDRQHLRKKLFLNFLRQGWG